MTIESGDIGLFQAMPDPQKPLRVSKEVLLIGDKASSLSVLGRPLVSYNVTSVFNLSWEHFKKGEKHIRDKIREFAMNPVGLLKEEVKGLRKSLQKDRSSKWPLFVRDFNLFKYWRLRSSGRKLDRKLIERTTNKKMKDYLKRFHRGEPLRIYTIRVLFRAMDEQLVLLSRYNHPRNNICITDFEKGTLRKLSNLEARNNQSLIESIAEGITEDEEYVHQSLSSSSYKLYVEELYYCHQCIDLLTALRAIYKMNKVPQQTFWKTTRMPTIRATLFKDEQQAHFVITDEYWPGAGGRLILGRQELLERCEEEFRSRNKPIQINNLNQYSKELHNHIEALLKESINDYLTVPEIESKNLNLSNIENYLSRILSWDCDQILRFADQKSTLRKGIINEIRALQTALTYKRIKERLD